MNLNLARPITLAALLAAFCAAPIVAQDSIDLWTSGDGAYDTYRNPGRWFRAKDGALLAFCEGRKAGRGDSGNIDLLMRRSEDGGRTWSPSGGDLE